MASDTENTSPAPRRQLGRGLSSLFREQEGPDSNAPIAQVAIDRITPGAAQPRQEFPEEELAALTESVRGRGVLQPILLRRLAGEEERYEIIAGERRWRAAQRAELEEIPALVRSFTDSEALEVALIENIQRSDLSPLEEARGFQRLIEEYGHTQQDIARAVGKSRSHIANTLRLLTLPPATHAHLEAGRITAGHARALMTAPDADQLADQVATLGLSVRETEKLAQKESGGRVAKKLTRRTGSSAKDGSFDSRTDPWARAIEESLAQLGLTANVAPEDSQTGQLSIRYESLKHLDELLARLSSQGAFENISGRAEHVEHVGRAGRAEHAEHAEHVDHGGRAASMAQTGLANSA